MDNAFGAKPRRKRALINITSLIDVMFLLLIFFMVSSTFRDQLAIDVSLPQASTAEEQSIEKQYEIVVDEAGAYFWGQQQVDEAGLKASLRSLLETEPGAPVVLRADRNADFGHVVRAIDIAREVGTTHLIVPTQAAAAGDRQ